MGKVLVFFMLLIWQLSFSQSTVNCSIVTDLGIIDIELYPSKAPKTVANFLKYVNHHLYDNSSFFRVCNEENEASRSIPIEVIQGGDIPEDKLFPPIKIETTTETGIKHKHGTISMARSAPDSAQSSFFICINDQPELDYNGKRNPDGFGFAAFGKVIKGMDIVLKIQSMENKDQMLNHPVTIKMIRKTDK